LAARQRNFRVWRLVRWAGVATLIVTAGLAGGYLTGQVLSASPAEPAAAEDGGAVSPEETSDAGAGGTVDTGDDEPRPLIIEDVTVQLLNASGSEGADDRVLQELQDLGFHVLAINPAARDYRHTTVFWSTEDSREAALALADHFDWKVRTAPESLSLSVTTHVVVGSDEA